MLALLDDDQLGPALHDPLRGLQQVVALAQLPRLTVVERDRIDALQQFEQVRPAALDPEIHRVARDELGLVHLSQHVEL